MRDEKPSINTVQFESESTVYLGAKIWELIPENIESSESVEKTNKKSRWNVLLVFRLYLETNHYRSTPNGKC